MALTRIAAVLWALVAATAHAAPPDAGAPDAAVPAPPDASSPDGGPSRAELEPPRAIGEATVPYPAEAPPHKDPVVVQVNLVVGADGRVGKVELLTRSLPVFDDAVLRAVQGFRFEPARFGGKAVPVQITFSHTFLPPPPPPPSEGPPLVSVLQGRLVELGTRVPVQGATVAAEIGGRHYTAEADARGRFRMQVPAGAARITVHVAGYHPFVQQEHLAPRQELAVSYYVERERYDPYEIVVVGEQRRQEVSRVTLRGPELKQVPGTFGDPFRVVQALPGVASIVSLLPFPVVRGASPGSTGFLLDGTRVPLLYHLLAGPSVLHPELIDEVQFYAGGAPVLYGGYTAGIVDGRTRRARRDESLVDIDVNLLQAGALVRHPVGFLGATATVAARVGYPGIILSLATDQASLSYWDYQLRLDGGNPRNGWTVFSFGARDELDTVSPDADPNAADPPLSPALVLGFHRLDLRGSLGGGAVDASLRVVGGVDETTAAGSDITSLALEPQARLRVRPGPALDVVLGLEGTLKDTSQGNSTTSPFGNNTSIAMFTQDLSRQYVGSALAEVLWRPTRDWLVRPGVRGDVYYDGATRRQAADPRLTLRYRLFERAIEGVPAGSDEGSVWLKGSVGVYHQPPRFFLPLPGLDIMPLRFGLLTAIQYDLGAEVPLGERTGLVVDGFYNDMDPVVFDLRVNRDSVGAAPNGSLVPTTTTPGDTSAQMTLDRLLQKQVGRAFGLEAMLRREAKNGLYGWLAYTVSLSERERDGQFVPFDFDRTHLVNLVGGLPLPRNWELGARLQYQSGRPTTTTLGYNTARTDGYFRIDLRIDKRAVYKKWLFDFYVDLTNAALFPEEITPGTTIRYVLPTFGVRGRI